MLVHSRQEYWKETNFENHRLSVRLSNVKVITDFYRDLHWPPESQSPPRTGLKSLIDDAHSRCQRYFQVVDKITQTTRRPRKSKKTQWQIRVFVFAIFSKHFSGQTNPGTTCAVCTESVVKTLKSLMSNNRI